MRKLLIVLLFAGILIFGCPSKPVEPNVQNISLEELNKNLDKYNEEKVHLEGYFGHKKWHGRTGMSYLVKEGEWLTMNTVYPEYNYVRLDIDAPETLEGKKIAVEGTVSIGKINLPIKDQKTVAVIKVVNYSVIN